MLPRDSPRNQAMQLGRDGQGWPWAAGQAGKGLVCPNPQGAGLEPKADEEEEEGGVGTGQVEGGSGEPGCRVDGGTAEALGMGSFEEGGIGRQQLAC